MRATHHLLLHEADEGTRRAWEHGFNGAAEVMAMWEEMGLTGYAEAIYAVLSLRGPWGAIFHWDYNPYNEGLVHGIAGLVAANMPLDQVRWHIPAVNQEVHP